MPALPTPNNRRCCCTSTGLWRDHGILSILRYTSLHGCPSKIIKRLWKYIYFNGSPGKLWWEYIGGSTVGWSGSFHEIPYTPTSFYLLPRVSRTSSSFYKTTVRVHRLLLDLLSHHFQPTSMEIFMEVNILPWMPVEVDILARKKSWKLVELYISWNYAEVSTIGGSVSFYCFHHFQDARIYYLEACMSFHINLHTSTCLHEDRKLPAPSTRLTLTLTVNPRLEMHPWRLVYFQLPWKLGWYAWKLAYIRLPSALVEASKK